MDDTKLSLQEILQLLLISCLTTAAIWFVIDPPPANREPHGNRARWRRWSRAGHHLVLWSKRHAVALAAATPLLVCLGVVGDTFFEDDNFRVVTPDLYRSGQLRSDEWSESYDEHRYRSVINLRGSAPMRPWYNLERSFANEHGLVHYDFGISDRKEPSFETMKQLVDLMRVAPKPLLIHCQAGADRSGLAAALYLYAVEGLPLKDAQKQLSLWYGHFPWLFSQTGAMDRAFEAFSAPQPNRWLPASGQATQADATPVYLAKLNP